MPKLRSAKDSWKLQVFWGRKPFLWEWVLARPSPSGLMAWFCGTLGIKPPKWLCYPVKLFAPRVMHGQAVISVFIYCLRILHIYAAKGMRAYTLAAAERMKLLRRLDAKEHRGKVIWTTFSCKQRCLGWSWAFHVWQQLVPCETQLCLSVTAKETLGIDMPCLGAFGWIRKLGVMRMTFFSIQPMVHRVI